MSNNVFGDAPDPTVCTCGHDDPSPILRLARSRPVAWVNLVWWLAFQGAPALFVAASVFVVLDRLIDPAETLQGSSWARNRPGHLADTLSSLLHYDTEHTWEIALAAVIVTFVVILTSRLCCGWSTPPTVAELFGPRRPDEVES